MSGIGFIASDCVSAEPRDPHRDPLQRMSVRGRKEKRDGNIFLIFYICCPFLEFPALRHHHQRKEFRDKLYSSFFIIAPCSNLVYRAVSNKKKLVGKYLEIFFFQYIKYNYYFRYGKHCHFPLKSKLIIIDFLL